MHAIQHETFEVTKDAFSSIEALVADARDNALAIPDEVRIHFAAEYLRLAAQKSCALAELLDAVSEMNVRRGDKAKKRIRDTDRDIRKLLDTIAKDAERLQARHGGRRVELEGEDAAEFLDAVRDGKAIPSQLFERDRTEEQVEAAAAAVAREGNGKRLNTTGAAKGPEGDIREDTMLPIECVAYQAWTEMTDLAYKIDGMVGVIGAVVEAAKVANDAAVAASDSAETQERLQRASVTAFLAMEYLPKVSGELRKLPPGPFYWEDVDCNRVEFPAAGQRLRTAAETREVTESVMEHFNVYQATGGRVLPGFWKGIKS